jgi:hypothetical protein
LSLRTFLPILLTRSLMAFSRGCFRVAGKEWPDAAPCALR